MLGKALWESDFCVFRKLFPCNEEQLARAGVEPVSGVAPHFRKSPEDYWLHYLPDSNLSMVIRLAYITQVRAIRLAEH